MAFLKAHWQLIVMGAVCVASIGAGVLAVMGTSDVEAKMKEIDGLVQKVSSYKGSAANRKTIEAKKEEVERRKIEFDASMAAALARQMNNAFYGEVDQDGNLVAPPRKPLMEGVLPEPSSAADAMTFRLAYQEEFKKLNIRLRARGGPTGDEIQSEQLLIDQMKIGQRSEGDASPGAGSDSSVRPSAMEEFLRSRASARAAEKVALGVHMYVDYGAFGRHTLAGRSDTPTTVEIWQAQMSLWIQQDIAVALARCNEERAAELKKQGHDDQLWVAYMPVKRLQFVGIAEQLGKMGGSTNMPADMTQSFTGIVNDDKRFVVPIQLRLIVEEAAIMNVLGHLCSIGFYTPIALHQMPVRPDPLYEEGFVYGEAPVVDLTIDLEGYYFRAVFEQWIPKSLKQILQSPNCKDDEDSRSGRG